MIETKAVIIEDELIVALDLELKLKSRGIMVVGIATDCTEAMSLVESNDINIVFCDININGDIDGIATAKKIQEKMNCHIIFISAFSSSTVLNRISEINSSHYLKKPFNRADLDTLLAKILTDIKTNYSRNI